MIRKYNTVTKWLGREQEDSELLKLRKNEVKLAVVKEDVPKINPETQRRVKLEPEINLSERGNTYTEGWEVEDFTEEELKERVNRQAEQMDGQFSVALIKERIRADVAKGELPSKVDKYLTVYPYYKVGTELEAGEVIRYKEELYEIIQGHTTQLDWKPNEVPAIYKRVRQGIEQWVQPTGAHDVYKLGDKVTHKGNLWESLHDNNSWEPPTLWKDLGKI